MIINGIDYPDKLIEEWERLSANLKLAIDDDWIPIPLDLEVEPSELCEIGYPNFEGKEIIFVQCPLCDRQYKFNQVTWFQGHKRMRCPGGEK